MVPQNTEPLDLLPHEILIFSFQRTKRLILFKYDRYLSHLLLFQQFGLTMIDSIHVPSTIRFLWSNNIFFLFWYFISNPIRY
jgi:hypothetical protein